MTRTPHYIKPNHSSQTPQIAIWFDTETTPERIDENTITHRLWFGWAACRRRIADGRWSEPEWLRFEHASELWSWIASKARKRTRVWACCHNSNFDLPVLDVFGELPKQGWQLNRAIIEGPPTILHFRKDGATIILWDTLNIWRMSLDQVGKQIGLPKLTMPGPYDPPAVWDRYGKRDVEVIMKACLLWWDMLVARDMGGFAPTLASQSMRVFRHRYMIHPIFIDDHAEALALARAGYNGGRVECFRIGDIDGPLHLFDVNSMYPAVMANGQFPCKLRGFTHRATVEDLQRWCAEGCVMADVTVDAARPVYPARHDDKLLFPVGRYRCVLATPELAHACQMGEILRVHAVAVYDRAPVFSAFVAGLYPDRLAAAAAGDKVLAWQLKTLLNAHYGKWGQRGMVFEEAGRIEDLSARSWVDIDCETGETTKWRQLGGLLQCQTNEVESRESFPAIAAHVTSYARMHLWAMILAAGRKNVFYTDTDSLLVNEAGAKRLQRHCHPNELGKLKLEGTFGHATIWGPKDYQFGTKARHKGVRKAAKWIDSNTVVQQKWSSLRGLLNQGRMSGPTTADITKHLNRIYTKGRVLKSGRVVPIVLEEE